jgi:hypothetical protein
MRRIAFFAHYDRDGIIDDHVIYYLCALTKVTSRILFATDCELHTDEKAKLRGLAEVVHTGRHGEYDFGSWKRCFAAMGYDLSGFDELIIVNDSCFAPLHDLGAIFAKPPANCDVWGASWETYRDGRIVGPSLAQSGDIPFINSYFMVFSRAIFDDPAFREFWYGIEKLSSKAAIIRTYEIGLSELMQARGYRFGALVYRQARLFYPERQDFPWARTMIFRTNGENVPKLHRKLSKLNGRYGSDYPRALIDNYIRRQLGTAFPAHYYWGERKGIKYAVRRLAHITSERCRRLKDSAVILPYGFQDFCAMLEGRRQTK